MAEIIYLQHLSNLQNIKDIIDKGLKGQILYGHGRYLIWFDYLAKINNKFYYTCAGKHTLGKNKSSIAFILSKNIIYEHPAYLLNELVIDIRDTDKLLSSKIKDDTHISRDNMELVINEEILDIKPYLEKIIIQKEEYLKPIKQLLTRWKLNDKVKIEVLNETDCNNEKIINNYDKDLRDIHSEMINWS